MNMSLRAKYRRRVLENSLIIATTVLSCTVLRADHENQDKSAAQGAPGQYEKGEKGDKTQRFIKEAAMGGQMEVQMGQLAEQRAQNPEVKNLGATLVRDHTQANQKLQQLAQQKGITLDQGSEQKHQKHLDALQSKSGAEFDKAFVTHAIKDHKKDIAKFEKCQKEEQDSALKAFIDETLPTLRNHLQLAQTAARTLGIDANVAADTGDDSDTAAGAPATGVSGEKDNSSKSGDLNRKSNSQQNNNSSDQSSLNNGSSLNNSGAEASASGSLNKPRSSTSSSSSGDSSVTQSQNTPSASVQGNIGENRFSANAGVNSSDSSTTTSTDSSVSSDNSEHKIFQKNDGKVLGLSTDKHDGKILGIIPKGAKHESSSSTSSSDVSSSSDTSIGGPATTSSGTSSSERIEWNSAPSQVKQALQAEGADSSTTVKRMTIYEAEVNGKKIHVTEDGKVYKHDQNSRSSR
jgi:putative membrane protein